MTRTCAVSPHPEATALGNRLLEEGRSAAEATVAMGAYLSVVMPHFCGIGGDAVWMVSDASGQVRALTGIGQAFDFTSKVSEISPRGPLSILTGAGAVSTWAEALRLFDVAPDLADLLGPAHQAARDGFVVTTSQEFWRNMRAEDMDDWPGFGPYAAAHAGEILKQPELAETFALLIRDGLASFYDGPLASRLAQDLNALGTPVTQSDLSRTRARNEAPLSLPYKGATLFAPPPPTQGITTLQIMGILARLDAAEPQATRSTALDYHLMVEAVKQAFLDRKELGDRKDAADWVTGLLSSDHLNACAARVNPEAALPWPEPYHQADTVYFAARDAQGGCVSALQSTYFDWGSGCVLSDTGVIWHNRGAGFSLDDGPNRLAPGQRPFHTLNPGIATRNGSPWLLYGTQGADGQPQTLTVLLRGLIDRDLSPTEALAQPRFLLGRTFSSNRDTLKIEPIGAEEELADRGHTLEILQSLSPLAGQAGCLRIEGHDIKGAHDPRR
jgi:gamma-glutamyltranspeptidase/glutathione hydrolase